MCFVVTMLVETLPKTQAADFTLEFTHSATLCFGERGGTEERGYGAFSSFCTIVSV